MNECSPKIMKNDITSEAITAINKDFSASIITGCNFHIRQRQRRQQQNVVPIVEYTEVKQVRLTCRLRAALA
jgi:hypothetical protein